MLELVIAGVKWARAIDHVVRSHLWQLLWLIPLVPILLPVEQLGHLFSMEKSHFPRTGQSPLLFCVPKGVFLLTNTTTTINSRSSPIEQCNLSTWRPLPY